MLRKKHRVPLHGKPNGYVEIESGATEGAVVGVNVWNQDGTLFVPATGSSTDAGGAHTYWRLILEIPANIQSLASLSSTGVLRRLMGGTFDTSAGLGDLQGVNVSGATSGDALVFNGTSWVPGQVATEQLFQRMDTDGDFRVTAEGDLRVTN